VESGVIKHYGAPKYIVKVTPCIFFEVQKEYSSHQELLQQILLSGHEDPLPQYQTESYLIPKLQSTSITSIARFPPKVYQTQSLIQLLQQMGQKIQAPFKYDLYFLYTYEQTTNTDDTIPNPSEQIQSTNITTVPSEESTIIRKRKRKSTIKSEPTTTKIEPSLSNNKDIDCSILLETKKSKAGIGSSIIDKSNIEGFLNLTDEKEDILDFDFSLPTTIEDSNQYKDNQVLQDKKPSVQPLSALSTLKRERKRKEVRD
jgi:hypothetical protein